MNFITKYITILFTIITISNYSYIVAMDSVSLPPSPPNTVYSRSIIGSDSEIELNTSDDDESEETSGLPSPPNTVYSGSRRGSDSEIELNTSDDDESEDEINSETVAVVIPVQTSEPSSRPNTTVGDRSITVPIDELNTSDDDESEDETNFETVAVVIPVQTSESSSRPSDEEGIDTDEDVNLDTFGDEELPTTAPTPPTATTSTSSTATTSTPPTAGASNSSPPMVPTTAPTAKVDPTFATTTGENFSPKKNKAQEVSKEEDLLNKTLLHNLEQTVQVSTITQDVFFNMVSSTQTNISNDLDKRINNRVSTAISSGSSEWYDEIYFTKLAFWSKFSIGREYQKKSENSSKFDIYKCGFCIGLDYMFGDRILVGISGSYSKMNASLKNEDNITLNLKSRSFSLYSMGKLTDRLSFTTKVGKLWFADNKNIMFSNIFVSGDLRYLIPLSNGIVTIPKVGIDYMNVNSCTENIKNKKMDYNTISCNAGVSFAKIVLLSNEFVLVPEIRASIANSLNGRELYILNPLLKRGRNGAKYSFGASAKLLNYDQIELDIGFDSSKIVYFISHTGYFQVKVKL